MSSRRSLLFSLVVFSSTFAVSLASSSSSIAADSAWQKRFDEIIRNSKIPVKNLGLIISRDGTTDGRGADKRDHILDIATLNADRVMTPASLTKIATAAAVLHKFPVGYQFVTDLVATHEPAGAMLNGDLFLRGGGDPGFVSESMWFLVNEFVRTGVKEIHGDLVVDDSFFDNVRRDPSRDQSAVDRAYDSPIGAMTFNWSSVSIFVRPGAKAGESARAYADPENDYIKLINKSKTTGAGETQLEATNETLTKKGDAENGETIAVSGKIAVGASEKPIYKSIVQPDIWAGYNLRSFLKQRGITVTGQVRPGVAPASTVVLASNKSKPIGELVSMMMKFSNNYIAEILTKDLGAYVSGRPGTMEKGAKVVRDFLSQIGLAGVVYQNPSGLSRKNSFAPRDLLRILQYVDGHFEIYPEYLVALPIGGVDGTLHKRMHETDLAGNVRAKTGSLDGIAGLAGFVGGRDGGRYEFAFLYNGSVDGPAKARELFDKILHELQTSSEKVNTAEASSE